MTVQVVAKPGDGSVPVGQGRAAPDRGTHTRVVDGVVDARLREGESAENVCAVSGVDPVEVPGDPLGLEEGTIDIVTLPNDSIPRVVHWCFRVGASIARLGGLIFG